MIKSIKHIHYKSFNNLKADIKFKQINLIFGYNGQGKSSFVDFMRENIEKRTLENFECSQENYKLFVYDEKYKRNTLYIDDDAKEKFSSFYAGKNIKEIIQNKKKIENRITKLENWIATNQTKLSNIEKEIDSLRKEIAQETRTELEKIYFEKYKIPQSYTKAQIKDEMFQTAILLSGNEFETIKKYQAGNEPATIEMFSFKSIKQISSGITELEKMLEQTPQNKAIERFRQDTILENFAKTALEIKNKNPQKYNEKCPLCEQNIATIKLWENLEQHFNAEYDKFIERLKKAKQFFESIKKEANSFIEWLNQNLIETKLLLKEKIDIDKLRQEYLKITQSFIDCLNSIVETIQEKMQAPNKDDITIKLNSNLNNIMNKLQSNQIVEIIKQHNEQQKEYNSIINSNIEKVKLHFIAKQKTNFIKLQKKNKIINDKIKKIKELKGKRNKQIKYFDEQLKLIDESFKKLNEDLNEWFFKDIKFEKIEDSHYITQRQDCNGKWFNCKSGLSEGEKTIISIIYFVNSYLATLQNLQEYPILIIDDPITSLDSKNKDKIVNYIFRKILSELSNGQVFILSHDKETMSGFNDKIKDNENIFCVEKINQSSNIQQAKNDILFNNDILEIYNKLEHYIQQPSMNHNNTILDLSRKLLEKLFVVFCGKDANFTTCYNDMINKLGLEKIYEASDIHELNHNKSDSDVFAELPNKVDFVLQIFKKATQRI